MKNIHPAAIGFVISPLIASLPIPAILDGSFNEYFRWEPWVAVIPAAYLSALVLGVPAYLLLRNKMSYTPYSVGFVGAIVAGLPLVLLLPFSTEASVFFLAIAFCGALGGVIFWRITRHLHGHSAVA